MKLQTAGEYGRNDIMEGQQEESSAACVSQNWETIKKDLSAGVDQKAHQVPLLAVTRNWRTGAQCPDGCRGYEKG